MTADNLVFTTSADEGPSSTFGIRISLPGNSTLKNIDFTRTYSTIVKRNPSFEYFLSGTCLSTLEEAQYMTIDGLLMAIQEPRELKGNTLSGGIAVPHTRPIIFSIKNLEYRDYINTQPPLGFFVGTMIDQFHFTNVSITNCNSVVSMYLAFIAASQVNLTNLTLSDMAGINEDALRIQVVQNIVMNNIALRNITASNSTQIGLIYINVLPFSQYTLQGMTVEDSDIGVSSIIQSAASILIAQMSGFRFKNVYAHTDTSLIRFSSMQGIILDDADFDSIYTTDPADQESSIISINSVDFSTPIPFMFSNMAIRNADISVVQLLSATGTPTGPKTISFSSINISDTVYEDKRDVISTKGFETNSMMAFTFTNLTISNLEFTGQGKLFQFKHLLTSEIMISSSNFVNLRSTTISVLSKQTDLSLNTSVKFLN